MMMDFTVYRQVCEQIGKLYSDLEVLEAKRAELERALNSNGHQPIVPTTPASTKKKGRCDRFWRRKAQDPVLRHFHSHDELYPEQFLELLPGGTLSGAEQRLRHMYKEGQIGPYVLDWKTGPARLVKRSVMNGVTAPLLK